MLNTKSTSRSQQVRQRRSSGSTRSSNNTASRTAGRTSGRVPRSNRTNRSKSTSRSAPPVLIRGDIRDTHVTSRQPRSRARRRYDIAMNIPGAEMRLPALPAVSFGWRSISFFLVAIVSLTLYHLWNSMDYRIEQVNVSGLQHLTQEEINSLLEVGGLPIFAVDVSTLYDQLLVAFPEFRHIQIQVGLPNAVQVDVEERQPVLVWEQDGRTVWVDEEGIAFPPRESEPPALVVAADGYRLSTALDEKSNPNQLLNPALVQSILAIQEFAPEDRPIVYDAGHGLGWRDRKWTVFLGLDFSNIDVKLNIYDAIEKRLKKENLRPALISVEHIHAPYFRMEP